MDRGQLSTVIDLVAAPSGSEVYTSSCLKEHLRQSRLLKTATLLADLDERTCLARDNENYITPAAAVSQPGWGEV